MRRALLAAVVGVCAPVPATAYAGSYDVYSCKVGSAFYGNNAWKASNNPNGGAATLFTADTSCAGPGDVLITVSKADSPHGSVLQGTAPSMAIHAGCWGGRTAVCSLGASDSAQTQLIGSKITIDDPVPPVISGPDPSKGLLAPGTRSGAEPVTFSANDNSGIRRAEMVDVTDAANPTVVASEDYNTGPNTDAGTRCDDAPAPLSRCQE
jgi:hypothetical protein